MSVDEPVYDISAGRSSKGALIMVKVKISDYISFFLFFDIKTVK